MGEHVAEWVVVGGQEAGVDRAASTDGRNKNKGEKVTCPIRPAPSIALQPDDPRMLAHDKAVQGEQAIDGMEATIRERTEAVTQGPEHIDRICNEWEQRKYEQREIDG